MTTEIEETYARFVKYYMEKFLMVLKRWPVSGFRNHSPYTHTEV